MIHHVNFTTPVRIPLFFLGKTQEEALSSSLVFDDSEDAWSFAQDNDMEGVSIFEAWAYVDTRTVKEHT